MSVEETIDALYALPLEEFTQARNQAERELRKAGEREQADRVKSLRKPTAAAAAVNQLVRSHRVEVEAFLATATAVRDAQVAGKGDLDSAVRSERTALEGLVAVAGESVRATLQAAAVDDTAARELLEARLEREIEPRGFGSLLAHAKPASKPRAGTAAGSSSATGVRTRPDDSAARTRLQEAKKTLTAAQANERQAQRHLAQTQQQLAKAEAAVEEAQRELDRVHAR